MTGDYKANQSGLCFAIAQGAKVKIIFSFARMEVEDEDLMERITSIKQKLGSALRSMSLTALPHGAEARVVAIEGSGNGTLRLMEMGVVPGVSISVVRTAPLGDPLQICLRNCHLALRCVDADKITVLIGG